MKKRVFQRFDDSVFIVRIDTEDWSRDDIRLMVEYGEPEVNVGGTVTYLWDGDAVTKDFGTEFARMLHGFPFARGFDARDYSSLEEAKTVGIAWKESVLDRIDESVAEMRAKGVSYQTEEVSEI